MSGKGILMTTNIIKLTIYIPTLNRLEKLRNCLNIISREIIGLEDKVLVYVSNNGSTDGTKEFLESLDYRWLHIRHNSENVGFALNVLHCFNLPIESEFVWPIGDDEYLMPNAISGILSLIKKYPEADYIFCNTTAFTTKEADQVLSEYLEKGTIGAGVVKSSKYKGTMLVDFEQLINPAIVDTLLGELMVNCFRQSSARFDAQQETWLNASAVAWEELDFEAAGRMFQPHNMPFLKCFSGKTKAVYCDIPRTFNFWGSADWIGDYDYTFPIVILFLISQYKERGFISDERYMKLLDYYYLAMRNPLVRQIRGLSPSRPFNSKIKSRMFDFLFEYMCRRWDESSGATVTVTSQGGNGRKEVETRSSFAPSLTSIIILTHNQLEHTMRCLQSVEQYTPELHEVIIVDNASTDATLDYLRQYQSAHPNVQVIFNKENKGFAGGNNQGLVLARGEYVLLLNNDTIVTDGWLTRMLAVFKNHPEVGLVGPMSNYVSGPQLINNVPYKNMKQMHRFAKQLADKYRGQSADIFRVVGFCLMIRRVVVDRVGGLDEKFGTGNFEDDDFCIRAAIAGFKARIVKDVFIHHVGGQTFHALNINYQQSLEKNWGIFKTKWNMPVDTPYGSYNISLTADDPVKYYIPLPFATMLHPTKANQDTCEKPSFPVNDSSERKINEKRDVGEVTCREKEIAENLYKDAILLQEAGKTDLAIKQFEIILEIEKNNAEAQNDIGVLYFQKENVEKAIHHLQKAIMLDLENIGYKKNISGIYLQVGRVEEAIEYYEDILNRYPHDVEVLQTLAQLCFDLGLEQDARLYLNRMREIEPDNEYVKQYLLSEF
jgi:GT2 family glycosyltransferase